MRFFAFLMQAMVACGAATAWVWALGWPSSPLGCAGSILIVGISTYLAWFILSMVTMRSYTGSAGAGLFFLIPLCIGGLTFFAPVVVLVGVPPSWMLVFATVTIGIVTGVALSAFLSRSDVDVR